MYIAIGGNRQGAEEGPRLLLEGCHRRICSFTTLALRLTESANDAPTSQIGEAAVAVCNYFGEALPKHVADEEQSVAPRLQTSSRAALLEMAAQHRGIEAVLEQLLDLWRQLAASPTDLRKLIPALGPPTSRLADLWEPHLALEEQKIFPLLDSLAPDEKAAIWREMRARRAQIPGQIA